MLLDAYDGPYDQNYIALSIWLTTACFYLAYAFLLNPVWKELVSISFIYLKEWEIHEDEFGGQFWVVVCQDDLVEETHSIVPAGVTNISGKSTLRNDYSTN